MRLLAWSRLRRQRFTLRYTAPGRMSPASATRMRRMQRCLPHLAGEIPPVITEALLYGGCCPLAPYAPPGTDALAKSIVETLGKRGMAALLARHGMIAVSPRDVDDAFRLAVHVEETAKHVTACGACWA